MPWGAGTLQLLTAEVRAHIAEAVPAIARLELMERTSRPVNKRLRSAVQGASPVPVA
jgi:hypothetical protein